jgi:signal transduction histidine kinase
MTQQRTSMQSRLCLLEVCPAVQASVRETPRADSLLSAETSSRLRLSQEGVHQSSAFAPKGALPTSNEPRDQPPLMQPPVLNRSAIVELREQLNAILGFAQVLLEDQNISVRQRRYLGHIRRAGELLHALCPRVESS